MQITLKYDRGSKDTFDQLINSYILGFCHAKIVNESICLGDDTIAITIGRLTPDQVSKIFSYFSFWLSGSHDRTIRGTTLIFRKKEVNKNVVERIPA